MNQPLISVLLTAYNYGRFIEESIDSVLSQDYPASRIELLVVDDGSTDDTPERVKKYGQRLIYLRKPNGGQASALNLGFANAHGEIISLLDADDLFLPGKLARVAEGFEDNANLGMLYHPYVEWNTHTNERRGSSAPLVSGDARSSPDFFLKYIAHPTSCISFRRTSLAPLLPIPERIRMLADGFLVDLMPFFSLVTAIPEPFALYRLHGSNCFYADERQMPSETRRNRTEQWQILFEAMQTWLAAHGYTKQQAPVRLFLDRWTLYLQSQKHLTEPPTRFRFFRFLILCDRAYAPYTPPKLRAINWFNAFASLLTGYKHFGLLDQWRLAATKTVKGLLRPSAAAKP